MGRGQGEVGICSEVKSNEGVEQICSLGCFREGGSLNQDPGLSSKVQGSTSVQMMTGSFFQLTGEHPAKVLARQRMTHADSAAGEGYEVTVSLCERLLLTPLIFALIPVKSDKSFFFFPLCMTARLGAHIQSPQWRARFCRSLSSYIRCWMESPEPQTLYVL